LSLRNLARLEQLRKARVVERFAERRDPDVRVSKRDPVVGQLYVLQPQVVANLSDDRN
jgi:hypothetical protein